MKHFQEWLTLPRALGLLSLVIGLLGMLEGPIPYISGLTAFYRMIAPELFGIGVTVLIIDYSYEQRQKQEIRERLTRDLLSQVTDSAVRAVDELRYHGWLDEVLQKVKGSETRVGITQKSLLEDAKLSGANLEGVNLQKGHLAGANLQRANLMFANLQEAHLWRVNLQEARLMKANLQGAYLEDAKLQKAGLWIVNLQGARLPGANLEGAYLNSANLEGADLRRTYLKGANFKGANLRGSNLLNATPFDMDQLLQAKSLEGASLPDGTVYGSSGETLRARLTQDLLSQVTDLAVRAVDELQYRGWLNEVLQEVKDRLGGAKWVGANLPDANLKGANLSDANLKRTNPVYANLEGADLSGANFEGANLWEANLEGADLSGANLEGASLWEANFEGADLSGANLLNATPFDMDQLLQAKSLEGATLPDGTVYRSIYDPLPEETDDEEE